MPVTTATAKVSSRYQVVIPKEVRRRLGLQPNDTLLFLMEDDRVTIRPRPRSFTQALRGLHQEVWQGRGEEWLREEREAWANRPSES